MNRRKFIQGSSLLALSSAISRKSYALPKNSFFVPPETHPHLGTIMAMPSPDNWYKSTFKKAIDEYINIANTISDFEHVHFYINPEQHHLVQDKLSASISVYHAELNDGWARDTAPIFAINTTGQIQSNGFSFKGWGQKFDYKKDNAFYKVVSNSLNINIGYRSPIEAEGGTFIHNATTVALTRESMFKGKRNPNISQVQVEQEILKVFGTDKKIIWIEKGLTPDPITDGHIDGMALFIDTNKVLLQSTSVKSDPNYKIIESARKTFLDNNYEVIDLPITDNTVVHSNSYFCNDALIVSASGTKTDTIPLAILKEQFPKKKIIPVAVNTLMQSGGGVRCVTQQIPSPVL